MLIGFIQQGSKSVIPRSGATWESPGTASVIVAFYQEIATPYGLAMTAFFDEWFAVPTLYVIPRERSDRGNLLVGR